jgi:hypothetical protein
MLGGGTELALFSALDNTLVTNNHGHQKGE